MKNEIGKTVLCPTCGSDHVDMWCDMRVEITPTGLAIVDRNEGAAKFDCNDCDNQWSHKVATSAASLKIEHLSPFEADQIVGWIMSQEKENKFAEVSTVRDDQEIQTILDISNMDLEDAKSLVDLIEGEPNNMFEYAAITSTGGVTPW